MLILLALLQQAPAQTQEIARIVVTPTSRTMTAGDTLRLRAEARDAQGNVMPGVTFRYRLGSGARFEGRVDSVGLVTAGSTAILPVTVTATSPTTKPKFEVVEIKAVPGPAASIDVQPKKMFLVAGQRRRFVARVYSAAGDQRADAVTWESSNPGVLSVDADGFVTARRVGTATITVRGGGQRQILGFSVKAGPVATMELSPTAVHARTGDVIRFNVAPKDAKGQLITGVTPTWSFSPGHGVMESDGTFVGY